MGVSSSVAWHGLDATFARPYISPDRLGPRPPPTFLEIRHMEDRNIIGIAQWVVAEALRGTDSAYLLDGFCARLIEAGLPLMRGNITQRTLHPVFQAFSIHWYEGQGVDRSSWERNVERAGENFKLSPYYHLMKESYPRMRVRLDGNETTGFPLLDGFRERGATDYLAVATAFEGEDKFGPVDGLLSSWTITGPGGFTDVQMGALENLLPVLAPAVKASTNFRIAKVLMETYLGRDAGRRVLRGDIVRGSVETIRAALWYCDIRGFTKTAESMPGEDLIAFLNDYFECFADPVHDRGGQVLKFMGDGFLAIFPVEEGADVCRLALDAADDALERVGALNEKRRAEGRVASDFYLALHLGDVMYGNIGTRERLDFTVVGPAVNEIARIEQMCRTLEQTVVVSATFAAAADHCTDRLVSLGRYALRGVKRPQELFTLVTEEDVARAAS